MFKVTFFRHNTTSKRMKVLTVNELLALQNLKDYTITKVEMMF